MALPGNGIFVVRGEMSTLITAMRRGSRWNSPAFVDEEKDGLMKMFIDLKQVLNRIDDLRAIDPNIFLAPFLEVIRTEETTGAVTSLALTAINKFLSYGLIDPTSANLAGTVERIADAVTHARFMGTDQSSDGVTLFRVVEVLHTLMRSPEGSALTNEAVCEVMLSCFKICFEPRLNELLRRFAEQALRDMVLLLFMRLPQFSEDRSEAGLLKKFQMMAASIESDKKQRKKARKQSGVTKPSVEIERSNSKRKLSTGAIPVASDSQSPHNPTLQQLKPAPLATTPSTPAGNILDMQGKITQTPTNALVPVKGNEADSTNIAGLQENSEEKVTSTEDSNTPVITIDSPVLEGGEPKVNQQETTELEGSNEYINSVGVRFTHQTSIDDPEGIASLIPYGLPCIQELFRFLILLCNPLDKQNTDTMIHVGLSLLTVAFEVGADNIGKYDTLLDLVKDDLCRNLIALMNSERLTIFAADLQLCFLLFESLRNHVKFQLEAYLKKISEIIASDNPKTPYEMRELALDNLLQLWRIPGFVAELYINYDCDLYCTDMFDSMTNLLSKYTLSATNAVYSTHIIAMDALLSVIESIESNCEAARCSESKSGEEVPLTHNRHSRHNSNLEGIIIDSNTGSHGQNSDNKGEIENISKFINSSTRLRLTSASAEDASITREHLADVKMKKRVLTQGTELFNQRPEKGIQYLQENGILNPQLDPMEVALFLRENPGLDKKMIGEYISKKKNVDSKILMNFVNSFNFTGLRVDEALRLYLETFRLPGEAPLIFLVLEHFADHWHKQNNEPFANTDAAFSLAYAIIMLNMDQHNANAKRLNVPMTQEDFMKNLRGLNGGSDFDQDMLATVFNAIKNEEIIMPAEQVGMVRENYLWKVLLRRGATHDGKFNFVEGPAYDLELFNIVWGASLSALSFMFDKSNENGYQRTLSGFTKCAGISAYYNLHEDFDAVVLTLCKFTTLLNSVNQDSSVPAQHQIVQAVNFGLNPKAQAAMKTVFNMIHMYGDCVRESWKNILDLFLQLFRIKLLPKSLIEVEDFCEPNGKVQLILEKPSHKQEAGIFSSLYSYLASDGEREPTYDEQEFIKIGKKCIKECQLEQMIQESKFVQLESLQELLKSILELMKPPNANKSVGLPYAEDTVVFWMELCTKIVIQNRDRMIPLWPSVRDQMYLLIMGGASCGYDYLLHRSIVALLKLAIYLMRNEELCPVVLLSLKMLLMLKPAVIFSISKQISVGIYELLKTSAQNIHSEQDWKIIFTILECVGAGAILPDFEDFSLPAPHLTGAKSDGALSSEEDSGFPDRGYISDSEVPTKQHKQQRLTNQASNASSPFPSSPTSENWILVNKDTDLSTSSRPQSPPNVSSNLPPISPLVYNCKLIEHSPFALFKCWDSLAFIVRNVAHITPYNFESCVCCIRTFVEACFNGGIRQRRKFEAEWLARSTSIKQKKSVNRRQHREAQRKAPDSFGSDTRTEIDDESLIQRYETLSIQLLDLMYTLYTRTAQIFRWWAEEGCAVPQCSALWAQGWCPLLQGIARLAMDRRREVRTYAISCLQQRALLVHDLQTLSGTEWSSCFRQVLFPLLNELLPDSATVAYLDSVLLEESRIRTATIMSKVFLHHLTPLIELGEEFNKLWLDILDYIEKFMKVGSDMLSEQMQEILKNMLLVMHSVRIFHLNDGSLHTSLWELTWRRIGEFLPNLKEELFRNEAHHASNLTLANQQMSNAAVKIPEVMILPKQALIAQNQTEINTRDTPQENTKTNAVLESSHSQSLILGQDPPSQNIPILVPQLQHQQYSSVPTQYLLHSIPTSQANCSNSYVHNPLVMPPASLLVKSGQILTSSSANVTDKLPDLVSDPLVSKSQLSSSPDESAESFTEKQQQTFGLLGTVNSASSTIGNNFYNNSCSFAIELPETPPTSNIYGEELNQDQKDIIENNSEQNDTEHQHQQHQQQTYDFYQTCPSQLEMTPQPQFQSQVQSQILNEIQTITEDKNQCIHNYGSSTNNNINVPISHTLAGNEYPSISNVPNPAIVRSFAPIYVQARVPQSGTDIYQEYVQNPYNLTLQHQQQQPDQMIDQISSEHTQLEAPTTTQTNLYATPANYFSSNVDSNSIPPGSEILFGQP